MSNRKTTAPVDPASPIEAHAIHPTAIYFSDTARRVLRLKKSSLRREIREGRLRVVKRCNRYYFLGQHLLDWLRDGEIGK